LFFQLRFGFAIEEYYSHGPYIFIYIASGIGGNVLSAVMKDRNISIGASTSIFGLLAVLGCFYAYNWHKIGVGRNFNLFIYACFVAVGFFLSFYDSTIDLYGHLGGYLAGGLLGVIFLPANDDPRWKRYRLLSLLLLTVYFFGLCTQLALLQFDCSANEFFGDCNPCNGLSFKKQ
jgi:rhomboid protease GluP